MLTWGQPLVDELLSSPVGAGLVGVLESDERPPAEGLPHHEPPEDVDPAAIERAAATVRSVPPGALLARAVQVANDVVGSWNPDGPDNAARALRDAHEREAIARALVERLADRLHAPMNPATQLWWQDDMPFDDRARAWVRPLGTSPRRPHPGWVTATIDGLWTCSHDPQLDNGPHPASRGWTFADSLVAAWEHTEGPETRWHLLVADGARVFEIASPDDWQRLVGLAPRPTASRYVSWEFPGMDRSRHDITALEQVAGQRAARRRDQFRWFVEPDWDLVAQHYDAVHLTWAGFLTCERVVIDLDDGDVTMLRWSSERTLWLNPVLSRPEPAPAPVMTGSYCGVVGVDVADHPSRHAQDLDWLGHKLG